MLISKEVKVNVGRNVSYYESLGYVIPKYLNCKKEYKVKKGTEIIVKVENLKNDSVAIIKYECDYCGKIFETTYKNYNDKRNNSIIKKDCCYNCAKFKRAESNLIKYGQNHHMKTEYYKKMFSKSYEEVYKSFRLRNCLLISKKYTHCLEPLDFICNFHKDKGIQSISWTEFNRGYDCKYCGYEKMSKKMERENNPNWNGGTSALNKYLRHYLSDWKQEILKFYNYKCVLTGYNNNLEIHHLYGMNLIIQEVLKELNLDLRDNIALYSEGELIKLEDKILEKHTLNIGVPIIEDLHRLFHKIYSNGNNSPEQFYKFKQRLKNGEFNNFLIKNNITLLI